MVVRERAVCFCAALSLLGVSEEQTNRCYSWSLCACVCVCLCVSGERVWPTTSQSMGTSVISSLCKINSILRARGSIGNDITVDRNLQTIIQSKHAVCFVCKKCFKYNPLYMKWIIADDVWWYDGMVYLRI